MAICPTEAFGTACSGSGAPTFAMNQLLPGNHLELVSSEKHVVWLQHTYISQLLQIVSLRGTWSSA